MKNQFFLQRYPARDTCSDITYESARHSTLTSIVRYMRKNEMSWSDIHWTIDNYLHDHRLNFIDDEYMYIICIDRKSSGIATKDNLPIINNSNIHLILMRYNDMMICMIGSGYQCCRYYYAEKINS